VQKEFTRPGRRGDRGGKSFGLLALEFVEKGAEIYAEFGSGCSAAVKRLFK
jgi:hypothetical protein